MSNLPSPEALNFDSGLYRPAVAHHYLDAGMGEGLSSGVNENARMPFILDGSLRAAFNKTVVPDKLIDSLNDLCKDANNIFPFYCESIRPKLSKNRKFVIQALPNDETKEQIRITYDMANKAADVAKVGLRAHLPGNIVLGSFDDLDDAAKFAQRLSDNYCGVRSLAPIVTLGGLTAKSLIIP